MCESVGGRTFRLSAALLLLLRTRSGPLSIIYACLMAYTCPLTGTFISRCGGGGRGETGSPGTWNTNDPLLSSTRAHLHGSLRPSVCRIHLGRSTARNHEWETKRKPRSNENAGTEEEGNERVRGRSTYGIVLYHNTPPRIYLTYIY